MWWRLSRAEWTKGEGEKNKRALKKIVLAGQPPGIVAYDKGVPVGWCALGPREDYPGLARSRSLKPVDDEPVWSITCFFVNKMYRRLGLSVALLEAAAQYAQKKHATILEGYPSVVGKPDVPVPFIWTGTETAFMRAGFVAVARPTKSRVIARRRLR